MDPKTGVIKRFQFSAITVCAQGNLWSLAFAVLFFSLAVMTSLLGGLIFLSDRPVTVALE